MKNNDATEAAYKHGFEDGRKSVIIVEAAMLLRNHCNQHLCRTCLFYDNDCLIGKPHEWYIDNICSGEGES